MSESNTKNLDTHKIEFLLASIANYVLARISIQPSDDAIRPCMTQTLIW